MFPYRFRQPSVQEQKQAFRKLYKKHLDRRRILLMASIFVVVVGVGFFFFRGTHPQTSGAETANITEPAPTPTEINQNFITQVNECFLPTAAVYDYDLRITSGFRTPEEQDNLYEQGRTIDGHIVTEAPAGKSIHNYGYAVDIADRTNGFDIDWNKLARIGAYCGLAQGGDGDLPHFENRGGLTTDQFKEGLRPPDLTLPCSLMKDRYEAGQALTISDLNACGAPDFNSQN
ncbi:MAG TPA: M15 family metallopeptidase [Patescibacteria group bacterium]|nr:M15 family metallopeptidase [Patescibacteria group bacterium]